MTLRTFVAADGTRWSVWRVEPAALAAAGGVSSPWLVFVNERGVECRRLFEIPPNWELLPPERLDLLRRVAEPAPGRRLMTDSAGVDPQPARGLERTASSRTFVDESGVTWQVWEVRPELAERRRMRDRRAMPRSGGERRQSRAPRPIAGAVHETLRDGWLAFRSDIDHRRRAPIPDGWTTMSDQELCALLKTAMRFERTYGAD